MLASVASVSNQVCDAAQLISTDFCWKCFKSNFEVSNIIAITKVFGVIKKHQQIKLQTRLVITQVSVDQIKLDSIWHFRVGILSYIDVIDIDLVTARRSIDIFRWGRPGVNILRTWEYQDSFGSSSSRTFSLHSENPFPFPGSQIFLGPNLNVLSLVFSCPMRLLAKPCGQQYVGQYCARQ